MDANDEFLLDNFTLLTKDRLVVFLLSRLTGAQQHPCEDYAPPQPTTQHIKHHDRP